MTLTEFCLPEETMALSPKEIREITGEDLGPKNFGRIHYCDNSDNTIIMILTRVIAEEPQDWVGIGLTGGWGKKALSLISSRK